MQMVLRQIIVHKKAHSRFGYMTQRIVR